MEVIYKKPESLKKEITTYCPGCGHGIIHRLIAEVIDELKIREITIGVAPVGCAVLAYNFFNFDVTESAHGRAPAVATAIKRLLPDRIVFTYQGDGDLAAIGIAEVIHAGARGENITIIFVNNAIYGMTKGQMAPTTLPEQKTTTTIYGRKIHYHGYPIKMCELMAQLDGVSYVERVSIDSIPNIIKTKSAIKKAFKYQIEKIGFSFIEILSTCPVNWKMSPKQAMDWITEVMSKHYILGVYKDKGGSNG
ncbi:MAG: thiamine pyrophosphate-dependent enzyme [Candidatus Omnitrophica bacterium]|nr:thiamine pyrophosphate-dependent enzyme [Candidatus Omnitrophota bacterium]MCM8807635.1 thiamine pyrophosphate-dependent enzyme [Candidatus Omnitrophota bacterium]